MLRSTGAELRWNRPDTGAGYEVHRSTTAGFTPSSTTLLARLGDPSATRWADTTGAPERTFHYRVRTTGTSPVTSNELTASLPAKGTARLTVPAGLGMGGATQVHRDTTSPQGCDDFFNNGAATTMRVGTAADGHAYRSLVRFDLRDIPAGATVTAATLSLSYQGSGYAGQVGVRRINREWREGGATGACDGSGANWNEAQAGVRWSTGGGDIEAAAATLPARSRSTAGSEAVDVAALVRQWVSGAAPNHGVALAAPTETPGATDSYVSYLSDDSAQAPTLTVTFSDTAAPRGPQVVLTAPQQGAAVDAGAVALRATAGDDTQVTRVRFYEGTTLLGEDTAAPYEVTATLATGSHQVVAEAIDGTGNTTRAPAVTFTTRAPIYSSMVWESVGNSVIAGNRLVEIAGDTTYNDHIAGFELLVDGIPVTTYGGSCGGWGDGFTYGCYAYWNTNHPLETWEDGPHQLQHREFDSSGRMSALSAPITVDLKNDPKSEFNANVAVAQPYSADTDVPAVMRENPSASAPIQDPYTGTVDGNGIGGGSLGVSVAQAPTQMAPATGGTCPAEAFCTQVNVANKSTATWSAANTELWYRWVAKNGAVLLQGKADGTFPTIAPAGSAPVAVSVQPPKLPPGLRMGQYELRFDLYNTAAKTWHSAKGDQPLVREVTVTKNDLLGLERFWQYDAEDLGAGMTSLTNVASGNMLVRYSPFFAPGRGLSSMVDLTYNTLEDQSRSPAGNNFSLSMSGLVRIGSQLDLHPRPKPREVDFIDGDGTRHHFAGTDDGAGGTRWQEPPGVNLYLREAPTNAADRRWALTRPDKVTYWFDADGYPTAVTDRNGNTLTFTLEDTPPGEDPGGPKKRITKVTDPGGRAFTIDYWSKDEIKKARVRGNVQRITDHSGSALDFDYYDDGNLLRLTQLGGTTPTGAILPDRSFVFTYTVSNGTGPAIPLADDRINPESKIGNQSSRLYSVRDPRGAETTYAYYGPSEGAKLRWKLKSRTNRATKTTSYTYDVDNAVTSITAPGSRTTKYTYDPTGKVTRIVNPLNQATAVEWSADYKVSKVTEPTGKFTSYEYNPNGYPTAQTDQLGKRNELTYLNQAVDAADTGKHLSLLDTVTSPKGVATTTVAGDYQTRHTYDAAGNIDKITDPTGAVTDYDYNQAGSAAPGTVAAIRDANGNGPTTYPSYDPSGQPTEMRDPLGNTTRFGYDVDGLLRWVQDPNHAGDSGSDERAYKAFFDYDAFHRMGRQSAPKSTATDRGQLIWSSVEFDANDNTTRRIDPHFGTATELGTAGPDSVAVYDAMDRPTTVSNSDTSVDPARERTTFAYDDAGRMIRTTSPKGVLSTAMADDYTTLYSYDALDRQTREARYGTGTTDVRYTHLCYDLAGDLRSVTSPRANRATVTCPGTGPLTGVGFTGSYDYDAAHRQTDSHDPLGNTTTTKYDANGNVEEQQQGIATGRVRRTTTEYTQRDQPFLVKELIDAATSRWATTRIEYDKNGNQSQVISPRGMDAGGASGPWTQYVTSFSYDARNLKTRVALPFDAKDGAERQYQHQSYDANGNLSWSSLPVTQSDPASVTDNARTRMTYFDPGWIRTSKDPRNPTVHFDYTPQGWQLERQVELKGSPGQLDDDRRMTWEYFNDGQQRRRVDRKAQASTYTYDAQNNLVAALDAAGLADPGEKAVRTQSTYDAFDEITKVRHRKEGQTNWRFATYKYDLAGNIAERAENGEETDAGGETKAPRTYKLTYAENDWLATQLDLGTDSACKGDQRIVNTFWGDGLEKKREFFRGGDGCTADSTAWSKKQTTDWTFFDNGKLRTLKTTSSTGTVTESHDVAYYDGANRYVDGHRTSDRFVLKRAEGDGATTCVGPATCLATYEYDARGRLVKHQKREGKVATYTFDQPANLLGNTAVRAGNVTTEVADTGTTTTKKYDADQLKEVSTGGATGKYWYDQDGNTDCLTLAAGSQADCSRSDGQGGSANLITDYAYDYLNRIAGVRQYSGGGTATDRTDYTYDALDRTSKEVEDHAGTGKDRTTDFTYQGLSTQVTEEKQAGGSDPRTKTFSYDAYGRRMSMTDRSNVSGSEDWYSYGKDAKGSVSQLIDDAGKVKASYGYDAYGGSDAPESDPEALSSGDTNDQSPVNPYQYTGKRKDSGTKSSASTPSALPGGSASYDMGARRFGPDVGRFLQEDMFSNSLSDLGLALDPLTQNRYALAGGNPISFMEYDGHVPLLDDLGDAIKEIGGKIAGSEAVDKAGDALKAADQIGGDLQDGSATNIGADKKDKEEAGNRLANSKFGEITGISDAKRCDDGSKSACAWTAANFIPFGLGKGAKGLKGAKSGIDDLGTAARRGGDCRANSFAVGTKVRMADGTTKPIEEIEVGDEVLATDPETGVTEARPVVDLIVGEGKKDLVEVTVDTDGEGGEETGSVIATAAHPFWVDGQGRFVDAKDLRSGDDVVTVTGERVEVVGTKSWTEVRRVHNFTVDGIHTYYVAAGEADVLVHNCKKWTAGVNQLENDVANAIEDKFPGLVKGQGRRVDRPGGSQWADHDVWGDDFIIEVTEGAGKKKTTQVRDRLLPTAGGSRVALYGPQMGPHVTRGVEALGVPVFKRMEDVVNWAGGVGG
ncbi:DNRLRE domain-containing protein [Micromonospora zamorensis]|uniref:DNRLRE domain-containing protein n=1 Tax=Micromonospora zamorensis TaxID=709883 RepID=UPI0037A41A14